jgi:hypothetical protein
MLKPGRKLHIKGIVLTLVLLTPVLSAGAEAEREFIIPGIDFSRLDPQAGAWCRYQVVDIALDIEDTTIVYFAIGGRQTGPEGKAFWIEIENNPLRVLESDRQTFKLLISDDICTATGEDSLGQYILGFYIKRGLDPIRTEDPSRLRDLPLGPPTADSLWNITPGVVVTTPAGDFSCLKKERSLISEKTIPAGRVQLREKRDDLWTVWFSDEVPIFHLVSCLIERSKETETIPAIKGIPAAGRRRSQTTADLIGFGFQAEPILDLNLDG